MNKKTYIIIFLLITGTIIPLGSFGSQDSIKGIIKSNTEIISYVTPEEQKRYPVVGNSEYINDFLKELRIGMSERDLKGIPIGVNIMPDDIDFDNDGVPLYLEKELGTSDSLSDTDSDGYPDLEEIIHGHNPLKQNSKAYPANNRLVKRLAGSFLMRVETNGSIWYLNPKDGRRYLFSSSKPAYETFTQFASQQSNSAINSIQEEVIKSQKVSKVFDGDTVQLQSGQLVRYIGIDTPELSYDDCYGVEAWQKNINLVQGKKVTLTRDISITDKEGRFLFYVNIDDMEVNKFMIENGFAFAFTYAPDIKRSSEYSILQRKARLARKGMWYGCWR